MKFNTVDFIKHPGDTLIIQFTQQPLWIKFFIVLFILSTFSLAIRLLIEKTSSTRTKVIIAKWKEKYNLNDIDDTIKYKHWLFPVTKIGIVLENGKITPDQFDDLSKKLGRKFSHDDIPKGYLLTYDNLGNPKKK
jgi:hypothetical protein